MNCFIDYRTSDEEIDNLNSFHLNSIKVPKSLLVYSAIDGHVDIQLNVLNKNLKHIIIHKDIPKEFLGILDNFNISYTLSKNSLSNTYPNNIGLNALILENHFIHNIKHTDPNLLKNQLNKKIINIKQGYTKCSILPIKDTAFITSDIEIYKILTAEGFDVLLIPPGDIVLPSLNYGFIGGTGGMISDTQLALFGDLKDFKYGEDIKRFLYKHEVEHVSLKKGKLTDRGSLFCL